MAQKRMFDKSITSDDSFLEMPIGSQLLYFHLSMNADDDGFINNWKSVMKMIGAKEDDLKILILKSYVIPFETGVIVIKHWKINNYLRSDRYKPTRFQEEYKTLSVDESLVYQVSTNGIPSIDKNSIDKNILPASQITDKSTKGNDTELSQNFDLIWKEYPKKEGKSKAFSYYKGFINGTKEYCGKKIKLTNRQMWLAVKEYADECEEQKRDMQYIKMGSTFFNSSIVEYVEKVENRDG